MCPNIICCCWMKYFVAMTGLMFRSYVYQCIFFINELIISGSDQLRSSSIMFISSLWFHQIQSVSLVSSIFHFDIDSFDWPAFADDFTDFKFGLIFHWQNASVYCAVFWTIKICNVPCMPQFICFWVTHTALRVTNSLANYFSVIIVDTEGSMCNMLNTAETCFNIFGVKK